VLFDGNHLPAGQQEIDLATVPKPAVQSSGKRNDQTSTENMRFFVVLVGNTAGYVPRHPVTTPPHESAAIHCLLGKFVVLPTAILAAAWNGASGTSKDFQATFCLGDGGINRGKSLPLLEEILGPLTRGPMIEAMVCKFEARVFGDRAEKPLALFGRIQRSHVAKGLVMCIRGARSCDGKERDLHLEEVA
jgi:hypothetical protein